MKMTLSTLALMLCLLAVSAGDVPASGLKIDGIGIKGGLNWSNWTGDDSKITLEPGLTPELKAKGLRGFTVGGFINLSMSEILSIQPEVLYTTRGTHWKMSGWKGTAKISYLEIPLLFRAELMPHSHTGHQVYFGPSFSFPLSSELKQESTAFDDQTEDIDFVRSPGLGLVLGGAIDITIGGIKWVFDMRYERGITKLASSSAPVEFPNGPFSGDAEPGMNLLRDADVHEKGFSVLLGISF